MSKTFIHNQFNEAAEVLNQFMAEANNLEQIENAANVMITAINSGSKIISCGNGGSMSDAMHFAEELTGRYRDNRRAMPAVAISDQGHLSCVANDFGYEQVFSRYVEALGKPGDVLLAISTSGNSKNVLRAAIAAHDSEMKVVALTGKDGGELAQHCDIEIRVSHQGYADRIQEIHIKVIHTLIGLIEQGCAE